MKATFDFVKRLQVRTAMLAIGRSTLRSQGAPGMVAQARKFLAQLDLRAFSVTTQQQFQDVLDGQTKYLADEFPEKGQGNWGAARKSLNIFLRDVLYCRPLCEHFKLAALEPWLEVPLDSNVYDGLLGDADGPEAVPPWLGVKALKSEVSGELQAVASDIASSLGVARVHLDIRYWRKDVIDELAGLGAHDVLPS